MEKLNSEIADFSLKLDEAAARYANEFQELSEYLGGQRQTVGNTPA